MCALSFIVDFDCNTMSLCNISLNYFLSLFASRCKDYRNRLLLNTQKLHSLHDSTLILILDLLRQSRKKLDFKTEIYSTTYTDEQ
jgi:hypothetical protein